MNVPTKIPALHLVTRLSTLVLLAAVLLPSAGLAGELPKYVFTMHEISDESSGEARAAVMKAVEAFQADTKSSLPAWIEVFALVDKGQEIAEFDYLYAHYAILHALEGQASEDYFDVARKTLEFLDEETKTGIWHFTELGKFQEEVYRTAGNGLGWYLHLSTDDPETLEEALAASDRAMGFVEGPEHYHVVDTNVRILLKLGRKDKAYSLIRDALSELPGFPEFQEFHEDTDYQAWLAAQD